MYERLHGKRVAMLVANGFEQVEMTEPRSALEMHGAQAVIVSPEMHEVRGWNHTDWGGTFKVDLPLSQANPDDFDALVLPGGVMNPDTLRMNYEAVAFVKAFFNADKPVAAICHGPWTLIEAGVVAGRAMTSYPSLRTDLVNAGAHWIDEEVVDDHGLITSRNPDDLPAFCAKLVEEIGQYTHASA